MTDSPNVTRLPRRPADPTGAERQKRLRLRRKAEAQAAATASAVTPANAAAAARVMPTVTRCRDGASASVVTLLAALGIATVSASFSIIGLTSVFAGAFWPVIAMGAALECAKLAGIAWLGRHGDGLLRIAMIGLVTILMGLSAIGTFGFLSSAHIVRVTADRAAIDSRAADVEARARVEAAVLADLDKRIHQIDASIDETIRRGRAVAAMALADQLKRARADLVLERGQAAQKLAAIEIEAARIQSSRAELAADDGPIRYLAELLGTGADDVTRWFILLVAVLLDPIAAALLLAASVRGAS